MLFVEGEVRIDTLDAGNRGEWAGRTSRYQIPDAVRNGAYHPIDGVGNERVAQVGPGIGQRSSGLRQSGPFRFEGKLRRLELVVADDFFIDQRPHFFHRHCCCVHIGLGCANGSLRRNNLLRVLGRVEPEQPLSFLHNSAFVYVNSVDVAIDFRANIDILSTLHGGRYVAKQGDRLGLHRHHGIGFGPLRPPPGPSGPSVPGLVALPPQAVSSRFANRSRTATPALW